MAAIVREAAEEAKNAIDPNGTHTPISATFFMLTTSYSVDGVRQYQHCVQLGLMYDTLGLYERIATATLMCLSCLSLCIGMLHTAHTHTV
jgi:hypothetical protein